jgi:hypothetical protein
MYVSEIDPFEFEVLGRRQRPYFRAQMAGAYFYCVNDVKFDRPYRLLRANAAVDN